MSLIDSFLEELYEVTNKIFSAATVTYRVIRASHLYFRVTIDENTFIDIYFNSDTGRKDFTLIHRENRIYGTDNLYGWHYHPFNAPTKHVPCQEPSAEDIPIEMRKIIEDILKQ